MCWLAGVDAAITIVGLPWARACFVIANFSFWPFGYGAVSRRELTGRTDFGTGPLGVLGDLIWFLLADWWLAVMGQAPSRQATARQLRLIRRE